MSMGWKWRSWPPHFPAHNFLSSNILSNVTAAYLVFCMTYSSWRSFSNGCVFLYSRTMLSDKQSEHSFNPTTFYVWSLLLKPLCCIREHAKSSLILSECFCYQLCLTSSQCFAMNAIYTDRVVTRLNGARDKKQVWPQCSNLRSFGSKLTVLKKVLVSCDIVGTFRRSPQSFGAPIVIRRPGNCSPHAPLVTHLGTEPRSESCNHIRQNVWQLWFARKFFTRHYYLLAWLNHLEISYMSYGIKT